MADTKGSVVIIIIMCTRNNVRSLVSISHPSTQLMLVRCLNHSHFNEYDSNFAHQLFVILGPYLIDSSKNIEYLLFLSLIGLHNHSSYTFNIEEIGSQFEPNNFYGFMTFEFEFDTHFLLL